MLSQVSKVWPSVWQVMVQITLLLNGVPGVDEYGFIFKWATRIFVLVPLMVNDLPLAGSTQRLQLLKF
jgi:hypothetical protein